MKCPQCGFQDSRVLDTRIQKDAAIRRRRECLSCKGRFSTIESVVMNFPHVMKKDDCREPFDMLKLRKGIQLACLKRPVSQAQIEHIVSKISRRARENNEREISTSEIGGWVMDELRSIDDVAYVRFASVYKTFKDIDEFVETLKGDDDPAEVPRQQ